MPRGDSRRDFLKRAGIAGAGVTAATWAAPSVLSLDAVGAAGSLTCVDPTVTGDLTIRTLASGDDLRPSPTGNVLSDTTMFLMLEQSMFTMPSNWTTDSGATLATNDVVCVWLLHHARETVGGSTLTGTLSFASSLIIGWDYRNNIVKTLDNGDSIFKKTGVTYQTGTYSRRTMDGESGDSVTPTGSGPYSELQIQSSNGYGYTDQMRIYVAPS